MADDILIGDTPKARRRRGRLSGLTARGRLWKHSTLADIDGVLSPAELRRMFVVTLVRNPWDRMVSYYAWARDQTFDHPAVRAARSQDFAAFLEDPAVAEGIRGNPARVYVTDAGGAERCDLFARLEDLPGSLRPLWDHLGFALKLDHLNRSDRSCHYRDHYDARSRAVVARLCAEDISRFGYTW